MFDTIGFIIGICMFLAFVLGFLAFLKLKGTPKFDAMLKNVKSKFVKK